jgi:SAM-dependent methyltransferase
MDKILPVCPYHPGSHNVLLRTDICLPEGPVQVCSECGLALSSCSEAEFLEAVGRWNKLDKRKATNSPLGHKRLVSRRRAEWGLIKKILGRARDIRVLDVGCATGNNVEIFSFLGADARGIDPAEDRVNFGRSLGRKLEVGYLDDNAYSGEKFDVVTAYEVIEHIPNPDVLLRNISRILVPGGIAIIGTGNFDSLTRRIRGHAWDFLSLKRRGGHICFYSPGTFQHLAPNFGMRLEVCRTYSVAFFEKDEVPIVVYKIAKLLSEFLSLPARFFGKGHQMECFLVKDT